MAGRKIKLKDQLGRVVRVPTATVAPAPTTPPVTQQEPARPAATVWKLIREIPANIQKLAKLLGTGFTTRGPDGEWFQRQIEAGEGIDVADGDGVAGNPTIGLAELANAGGGTLQKTLRDDYGRLAGTSAATTTDLDEGHNLYFTDARADARASAAVSAHVAASDPHTQYAKLAGDRFTGPVQCGLPGIVDTGGGQTPLVQTAGPDATHVVSVRYSANAVGAVSFVGKSRSTQIGVAGAVLNNDVVGEFRFVSDDGTAVMVRGAALVTRIQGTVAAGVVPTRFEFSTMNAAGAFAARWRVEASGELVPHADNTYEIGASANRPKQLWAVTGTINTSDAREKTPVRPLTAAELAAAAELGRKIGVYRWLAMVEAKGEAARQHIGMTVQRAIAILESHGLDPFAYGFVCYDEWDEQVAVTEERRLGRCVLSDKPEVTIYENVEESMADSPDGDPPLLWVYERTEQIVEQEYRPAGDRYSFRMDELLAFIARGMAHRLDAVEQRLAAAGL